MHLWSQGGNDPFIVILVYAAQYKYPSIIIIKKRDIRIAWKSL